MTEPEWGWLIPIVNLVIITFGMLYGLAILKASLISLKETLAHITRKVEDYEHRITRVETKFEQQLGFSVGSD